MILHLLCTSVAVSMTEVAIKISQSSAVTQTVQGGLIIHFLAANVLQCNLPKTMKVGLRVSEVLSKEKAGSF